MDGTSIRIQYDFKIIPFDDALWKLAFRDLRDKFNIEPITILETKKFTSPFMRLFDVYVDKALIDKQGYKVVEQAVRDKIDNKLQKEMELFFENLISKMEDINERKNTI